MTDRLLAILIIAVLVTIAIVSFGYAVRDVARLYRDKNYSAAVFYTVVGIGVVFYCHWITVEVMK
jgi:hypothetical protein